MVSTRKVHNSERPSFELWMEQLALPDSTKQRLREIADQPEILLVGQEMVEILIQLNMDDVTLQAALVFPYCQRHELSNQDVVDNFGSEIGSLVEGVRKMEAIRALHGRGTTRGSEHEQQIDSVRRMLLAMVEDVRAVVIKMAERICALQSVKKADEETRVMVATECASIYAPLANRLGIGQLKWELEDLAFRYLHPQTYKHIAGMLDEKRADRTQYIEDMVDRLQGLLNEQGIQATVYGRPKHIFSIWKKMQKKRLSFEQLFDIRAMRIIADRLQDCYAALGIVHANFKHIPNEFDDYIATPKTNGYQSIHTVIVGPQGKSIEIQIRTQQMHQDAELGVAAHWKYKEGPQNKASGHEERLNWLRKILQWQEEVAESGDIVEELRSQVFDDRVYVFTPRGDVLDLPLGATPLDFAYYIHTNIGHRCNGAKVNGRIVPFTYRLKSGDQVEILTGKEPNPSRDWMHPGLGYIHSSRARATIHSFFKRQDRDKNLEAGKEIAERELNKAHVPLNMLADALDRFNQSNLDDLYAAIGIGDVKIMSLVRFLKQKIAPPEPEPTKFKPARSSKKTNKRSDSVEIEGVGHLMSHLANCCQPVPGEPIVGYITQGRGVSVHRLNCDQVAHLLSQHPERQLDVNWADDVSVGFEAQVIVMCTDRTGILRDITTVLANQRVALLGVNSISNKASQSADIVLTIEVQDVDTLRKVMSSLNQINDVYDVARKDA
jgi:GTP pyrophosphokinase